MIYIKHIIRRWIGVVAVLMSALLASCSGVAPTRDMRLVDSLNSVSYDWRYKNLDSAYSYANMAFDAAHFYGTGRAEACNNMAFCSFMRMDFDEARKQYELAKRCTHNEMERLVADVGLMSICQRTAMNREFYDYRNSAMKRMKLIDEDKDIFTGKREEWRMSYAYSAFHIISAVYYYGLLQRSEAQAELGCVDADKLAAYDVGMYTHYMVLRSVMGLDSSLGSVCDEALQRGLTYPVGDVLCRMSQLATDSVASMRFGEMALRKYASQKYIYGVTMAYTSMARCLNEAGNYTAALDTLTKALDGIMPQDEKSCAVPELMSMVREQLSVAYAGLGMKEESDYNRNVYLDILNYTRQDKELESRYAALEAESRKLTFILVATIIVFLAAVAMFVVVRRRAKRRGQKYLSNLRQALTVCGDITSHSPLDVGLVNDGLDSLFGHGVVRLVRSDDDTLSFNVEGTMDKSGQTLLNVLWPYVEWVVRNERNDSALVDEYEQIEAQRYIHSKHIEENKRRNLIKRACLSLVNGVMPYADRALNEMEKLTAGRADSEEMRRERYQYINELVDKINEHNEILALWIKMRSGAIQLNVENFELNELFSLLEKSRRSFELKHQTLNVSPTDCVVKADKALTLFMINTLAENARKYTPDGGCISVSASSADDYIEVAVEDNGIGMSADDVATITGSKVYDSREIGVAACADRDYLIENKGSGFGLMNCKGIIEKYRKSNPLFGVCAFGVDSEPGKGSRFYFRLPKGVMKCLTMLVAVVIPMFMALSASPILSSCSASSDVDDECYYASASDSTYSQLLDSASLYADSIYFANVDRNYGLALEYAFVAVNLLNRHYLKYSGCDSTNLLALDGDAVPAEFAWWGADFDTDYHVILDVRNEVAVASLSLGRYDEYRYNNDAYTGMYKLQGKDGTIENDCRRLERSAVNKTIGLTCCILLALISIIGYYLIFARKKLAEIMNLRQVLEVSRRVFEASQSLSAGEGETLQLEDDTLRLVPQRIVADTYDCINDLFSIERLGLAVRYEAAELKTIYVSMPCMHGVRKADGEMPVELAECMYGRQTVVNDIVIAIPLTADASDSGRCIGGLYIRRIDEPFSETDVLLAELVARYFSIAVYNSVLCPAMRYRNIESANEESRRASWEESMLHVQNMVLDNCLSTIKHETIYYPNRIKAMLGQTAAANLPLDGEKSRLADMKELMEYYKAILSTLYSCASRQLEEVTFRRAVVPVGELTDYCTSYFKKRSKGMNGITLGVETVDAAVIGDKTSLCFMIEALVDEALTHKEQGALGFMASADGEYIRFSFTDGRRSKSVDELNRLFTPDLERMTHGAPSGELVGTEYLVCKQIVREHDEYAGRRGCRINAEQCASGGFTVYFTIPMKRVNGGMR